MCESAQGIWILDKNLPLGQDIATLFKLNKAILDIDILPNRGDCLSIIGLAREIAAIYNIDLKKENWECIAEKDHTRKKINNEIPEPFNFASGHRIQKLVDGIHRSSKEKRWVMI